MIKFNVENKKLEDFMEMTVKFGAAGEPFENFKDFLNAVYNYSGDLRSSSGVDYDNQENEWKTFADKYGYDGKKELANEIAKLMEDSEDVFPGLEGLAALSGNKKLLDLSDYSINPNTDQLIMSLFYGGNRLRQWKQYAKPYITAEKFIEQLINAYDFDTIEWIPHISKETLHVFKIHFEDDNEESDKNKMLKLLENADGLLDFKIAENFEAPTWTVTVK